MNLNQLFADPAFTALCWTLFHSLWQGALFAAVSGVVILFTRQSPPVLRYRLLTFLFFALVIVSAGTFVYELQAFKQTSNIGGALVQQPQGDLYPIYLSAQGFVSPSALTHFTALLSGFISTHAAQITAVWLIILLFRIIKMSLTLGYTRYMGKRAGAVSDYWTNRMQWYARQLQISKTVKLMESAAVKIPVVFGHIKPVIFVPLGMLAKLPADQIEAILIHELAHIRRSDYLVNLLQNIAESLFFFNPALLWISSLIRAERENCCDDIAIEQTNNKRQYVEALIGFRELTLQSGLEYSTAFAGQKGGLLQRVSRIVRSRNHSLNIAEKSSLTCCVLLIIMLAFLTAPNHSVAAKHFASSVKHVINLKSTGHNLVVNQQSAIDKKIAPSLQDVNSSRNVLPGAVSEIVIGRENITTPAIQPVDLSSVLTDTLPVNLPLKRKIAPPAHIDPPNKAEGLHKSPPPLRIARTDRSDTLNKAERLHKTPPPVRPTRPTRIDTPAKTGMHKSPPPVSLETEIKKQAKVRQIQYFPVEEVVAHISDFLFDKHIITNRSNLNFELTNSGLIVNGVKQPDDLKELMANRYFNEFHYSPDEDRKGDPHFGIFYRAETGQMGVGLIAHVKMPE